MWPPAPIIPDADDPPEGSDAQSSSIDAEVNEEPSQDLSAWEDWPVQAKLAMVLDYLRQSYQYCIFCGCQVCMPMGTVYTDTRHAASLACQMSQAK